jgi:hypothetical protein
LSLLPRRGLGRHGHPGGVAVHPGWTLSPTAVTEPVVKPQPAAADAAPVQPTSRWTSSPAVPPLPEPVLVVAAPAAAAEPAVVEAPPVAVVPALVVPASAVPAVVAAAVVEPAPEPFVPAEPEALANWASEWEAVAATPTTPGGPLALHTAAAAALDAVFGAPATTPWVAAEPEPAPVATTLPWNDGVLTPRLSALDLPLPELLQAETPLAAQAVAAMAVVHNRPALPPPTSPPPPTPPRTVSVPSPAQQLIDRAIRNAPGLAAQRRSTVRLGFTDASVIDLRPDDPIAKALHTVAAALIGRDRL